MSRLEFSRKTRQAIIVRANGSCELCSAVLKPAEGEVDHILPCALGGEPTLANGRLLCTVCHRGKTTEDVQRIRKADRVRDKASGAIRPVAKIKSAGFVPSERTTARQSVPKLPIPQRKVPLYAPKEDSQP